MSADSESSGRPTRSGSNGGNKKKQDDKKEEASAATSDGEQDVEEGSDASDDDDTPAPAKKKGAAAKAKSKKKKKLTKIQSKKGGGIKRKASEPSITTPTATIPSPSSVAAVTSSSSSSSSASESLPPQFVGGARCHIEFVSTVSYPANRPCEDQLLLYQQPTSTSSSSSSSSSITTSPEPAAASTSDGLTRSNSKSKRHKGETKTGGAVTTPSFFGVLDGHGGHYVSLWLKERMHDTFQKHFREAGDDSAAGVRTALEKTFNGLDAEVLRECKSKKAWIGAGSCGLVAVIHPAHGLHVACAGDSRAVLAVEHNGGVQHVMMTNEEHNCRVGSEAYRLWKEFRDEPDVVSCAPGDTDLRVKGVLQVTRAFGDVYLKDPKLMKEFTRTYQLRGSTSTRSPTDFRPYISAAPAIEYDPLHQARFLIVASDGLWDNMSPDMAVGLVARYEQEGKPREGVAEYLKEWALERVAFTQFTGVTVDQIKKVIPGDARRGIHDDITIIVVFFGVPPSGATVAASPVPVRVSLLSSAASASTDGAIPRSPLARSDTLHPSTLVSPAPSSTSSTTSSPATPLLPVGGAPSTAASARSQSPDTQELDS